MNRRTAIRNVALFSAGVALLPSCFQNNKPLFPLKNISLTAAEQDLLAGLAEAIIPTTKTFIGAKELKAHEFVMTMMDDCAKPEDQQKFTAGIKQFEELCKKKWDTGFVKCTAQQKNELLQQFEKKKDVPEDAMAFYGMAKNYTVQCFTSSKQYLLDVRKYKMVPGSQFKGCVPVKAA